MVNFKGEIMNNLVQLIKDLFGVFTKAAEASTKLEIPNLSPLQPLIVKDTLPTDTSTGMTVSKKGYLDLADREGLSFTSYLCDANEKTIGFGSTKSDIPDLPKWSWEKTISAEEAISLLKKGSQKYINGVKKALKVSVTQSQFDALVSITYNIGVGGMANSTFMKKINSRAPLSEILSAIKQWNKVDKKVNKGLINRRKMECDMFEKGIYQNKDGCVDLINVNPKTHKPSYGKRYKIEHLL